MDRTDCIYLIGCEANTLVKIGRSVDVQERLAALRTMSPVSLTLLWQTLGGADLEAALHGHFGSRRAHGEWFDFPDGDAVACVVQALPEIAGELQRIQRVRTVRLARLAEAAEAAPASAESVKADRDELIRSLNAAHVEEHGRPISADKLVEQVRTNGHRLGKTTALRILADLNGRPLAAVK